MFDILRYELYKMKRLKKVYFCAFAINFLPLLILFILTVLFFKGMIYRDFGVMQQMFVKEFGGGIMGTLVVLLSFFPWSSWFFQTIIAGELIAKEFENKSIKLMLLMPFKRLTIYLGKLLSTIVFFVVNMLIYLSLCALIGLALDYVFGFKVFSLIDYHLLVRLCNAYFVINFSYIALVFLVSIFARSAESTMAFTIFATFALKLIDAVILLFGKIDIIPIAAAEWLVKYSYLKSCEVIKYEKLIRMVDTGDYLNMPLAFDMLQVNIIYSIAFLFIGYQIFKRKEEKG